MSPSKASLYPALMRAQAKFAKIEKTSQAHQNKYAPLEVVLEAVRGALANEGLVITQPVEFRPKTLNIQTGEIEQECAVLRTVLTHAESGESIESTLPIALDSNPQRVGSAMTYYRRYSLLSLLGVQPENEDDEADSAAGLPSKPAEPKKPAKPPSRKFLTDLVTASVAHAANVIGDEHEDLDAVSKLVRKCAGEILGLDREPKPSEAKSFEAAIKRVRVTITEDGVTVEAPA